MADWDLKPNGELSVFLLEKFNATLVRGPVPEGTALRFEYYGGETGTKSIQFLVASKKDLIEIIAKLTAIATRLEDQHPSDE